jgi:hypothetical protein
MGYHVILKKRVRGCTYDINVVRRPSNTVAARLGVYDKNRKIVTINEISLSIWLTRGAQCSRSVSWLFHSSLEQ